MKIEWRKYQINGKEIEALVTIPESLDQWRLRRLYSKWKKLNSAIKKISTRGINIPEAITENAFCLFFDNCVRIVSRKGEKCAFDCLNTHNGEKIQIKAASMAKNGRKRALTEFSIERFTAQWKEVIVRMAT